MMTGIRFEVRRKSTRVHARVCACVLRARLDVCVYVSALLYALGHEWAHVHTKGVGKGGGGGEGRG